MIVTAAFSVGFFQNSAIASDEKPIKWRLQAAWKPVAHVYKYIEMMADEVRKRSKGKFLITVYPGGSLVKPMELFDAVSAGTVDMAISVGWYHAGKLPEAQIEAGLPLSYIGDPFSIEGSARVYAFFYDFRDGEVMTLLRQAYDKKGIHLIGPVVTGGYGFFTKFPVKGLEDFKGKKIRCAGLFSKFVKNIGAVPVTLPGSEIYLALQRGTVDGTTYTYYSLIDYKFDEVVKYVVTPPLLVGTVVDAYTNKKAWKMLPDDMKRILSDCLREAAKAYSEDAVKANVETFKEAKKRGVDVISLPNNEMEKLRELAIPIWDSVGEKNPRCAKLVELLKAFYDVK